MQAANAAVAVLRGLSHYSASQHVACYLAIQDEFMTMPLIEALWQDGKTCYLPVLTMDKSLKFVLFQQDDALIQNQYGINEPISQQQVMPPQRLDIVIMPLIAFDQQGNRLGTGGGYYDRSFAWKRQQQTIKPFMIGLGYAVQQADQLPAEAWDIPLDGVITERGFIQLRPSPGQPTP